MAKYDVAVLGAGMGGLVAAALLSKLGKKVILIERGKDISGRANDFPYKDGFRLELGGHLIVDEGTGLFKICDYIGKPITMGPANDSLPYWTKGKWYHMQELYDVKKDDLRRIIKEIVNMGFDEIDKLDGVPIRTWVKERTDSEGILALYETLAGLEFQTMDWWDHSASEFLWMRKVAYQTRNMAAFSYWPEGGPHKVATDLVNATEENGGKILTNTIVSRIVIENGRVRGVNVHGPRLTPDEYPVRELIEADNVLCTIPVWALENIVSEDDFPQSYMAYMRYLSHPMFRASWIGFYAALDAPIFAKSQYEIAAWDRGPYTNQTGYSYLQSAMAPEFAPPGKHLFICDEYAHNPMDLYNEKWLEDMFGRLDQNIDLLFPDLKKHCMWKSRHVVDNCMVYHKPYLVGAYRLANKCPFVEGLYWGGDTAQGRGCGIDRSARTSLTCTEHILGERIPEFKDAPHL